MKTWAVLALVLCFPAVRAQSTDTQSHETKGIDQALLARAKAGNADAEFQVGLLYVNAVGDARDDAQAAAWFRKAAKQGEARAEYYLGIAYLFGKGAPVDYTEGIEWFRKAAEQGNSASQTDLAHIYYEGKYIPQDFVLAAYWYRRAAELGNPDGEVGLASLYEKGEGVPRDYKEAYFWMSLAAANPQLAGLYRDLADQDASERDRIASHLTGAEIQSIQQRTRKWLEDQPHKAK